MPERTRTRASVAAFFALAYILSWTCWIPLALLYPPPSASAPGARAGLLVQQILGNYGPSLAALLMLALFGARGELKGLLARLRPRRADLRWAGGVLLLPLAVLLPGALAYALLGGRLADLGWGALLPSFLLSVFVSGLGEELGWRGYALPRLQAQRGPLAASVLIALLWAGWHLPVLLWTSTQTGWALLVEFALYTLTLTAFSIVFTRVYNATGGKLWPVVLLHAALTATGNCVLAQLTPGRAGTWVPYVAYVLSACGVAAWIASGPRKRRPFDGSAAGRTPSASTMAPSPERR